VPPTAPPGRSLAQRLHTPRTIGLGLGGICVAGALAQHGASAWLWGVLSLNALAWPHIAWQIAMSSPQPFQAEHRNLVLDSFFGAFWLPAIGFNVLPSVLLIVMLTMNNLAVGGARLLAKGFLGQLMGVLIGWAALDIRIELTATLPTIIACLPFLVVYPLTMGWMNHRLSSRLAAQKAALTRSERLHRETLDAMEAGIVLYGPDDRIILFNRDFQRLYAPLGDAIAPGRRFEDLLRAAMAAGLVPEARGQEEAWLAQRLAEHRHPSMPLQRQIGGRWRRLVERRLPDGSLLAFSTDVTDLIEREQVLKRLNDERDAYAAALERANEKLAELSETDELTGLANRRQFDRRLRDEWPRAKRSGEPLALLMVDVDHFKRFNDRYGHPEGDACLVKVAQALRRSVHRPADVAARYGGEEFKVLLPQTNAEQARVVGMRCLRAVDACAIPHEDSPVAPIVTVSIGVAVAQPGSHDDVETMVRRADEVLYRAKAKGRHRVEVDASLVKDG
jgi:diguanylate cyclase (GGDEF)-like protein